MYTLFNKCTDPFLDRVRVRFREKVLNPLLGGVRKRKLLNPDFTIISNNCWAGHVYRYFNIEYKTPTVGMYFFADEYVKFLSNLRHYLQCDMKIVPATESRYMDVLRKRGEEHRLIGVLDDVEIVLLHYASKEEALTKWRRRCQRINYDNILIKFSEQNLCSEDALQAFDKLPYKNKIVFTHKDYALQSQIIFEEFTNYHEVPNDTTHFNRYIDLVKWLNR